MTARRRADFLAVYAPDLLGRPPAYECEIELPGGDSISFEEFDPAATWCPDQDRRALRAGSVPPLGFPDPSRCRNCTDELPKSVGQRGEANCQRQALQSAEAGCGADSWRVRHGQS